MRLIVVTGMPGAGKEEFLTVARNMEVPFLRMGDIVRERYVKDHMDSKNMNIGKYASSERKIHGTNIWAERALETMSGGIFLIDGCRSMDEVRAYRNLSDDVTVIAIHASPHLRYERLVKRARSDAPHNIEEFNDRDERELSWGLGNLIALSDVMIDNSYTLDEFHKMSKVVLERMI